MPDKKTLLGVAIGVGCTLAAPFALSLVAPLARPLAKGILKRSFFAVNHVLEKIAVAAESMSDLVAEVRAEVDEELARRGPPRRREAPPVEAGPDGFADGAQPGVES